MIRWLIAVWRWLYRSPEWQPYSLPNRTMRRWNGKQWEYRDMTDKEARKAQDERAY